MDNFLRLENRHTGEVLVMRRVRDAQGQIVLTLDGTLPPGTSGPPLHVHFNENEEGIVKAGTLGGAQIGKDKFVVPAGGTVVLPAGPPSSMVECGRRSAGVQRPRSSGGPGSLSPGGVRCSECLEWQATDILFSACALASSRHTIAFNSSSTHSANPLACRVDHWALSGQI